MPAKFSILTVAALPLLPIAPLLACGGDDGPKVKVPDASVDSRPGQMDAQEICTATASYSGIATGSNTQNARSMGSGSQQSILYAARLNADTMPDILDIELYAGYGAFAGGITAKTVDLSDAAETNYKDCGACVLVLTDLHQQGSGVAETDIYMANGGTLTLTSVTTNFQGTLSNVTLRRVNIGSDGTTTNMGACTSNVSSAMMNTPIMQGSAVLNVEFEGEFIDGRAQILRHRRI